MAIDSIDEGRAVLARRTGMVRVALIAFIATSAIFTLAEIGSMAGVMDTALDGESAITGIAGLLFLLALILSYIFVGMWLHRAQANLHLAGCPGLQFTPGWAVGWYFIPFANLVKPYQAMRELWVTSHGQSEKYGAEASGPLGAWWACWLIGNIMSNIGTRIQYSGGADAAQAGLGIDALASLVSIAAAWLLLRIVNRINEVQQSSLGIAQTFA